jgi:hypothetical protein
MTKEEADNLLFQEQVIAQVLAIRSPASPPRTSKSWKELIFETAGGVALITVLLGGIVGGAITTRIQSAQKENETEHAEQQARLQREAATRERMDQIGLDAAKDLFGLMYEAVSSSEDLLQLSTKAFADRTLSRQRDNIRGRYNKAEQNWRSQHNVKGLMFVYYQRSIPGLPEGWGKAEGAVTKYLDCSGGWIEAHPFYTQGLEAGCSEERKKVEQSFAELEHTIVPVKGSAETRP